MDEKVLIEKVSRLRDEGFRLMVINATSILPATAQAGAPASEEGAVELTWSFEYEGRLEHVRELVAPGASVPSVSQLYSYAYLYENEIAELFGVNVTGRNVDFKGQLYQTSEKVPMSPKAIRARLEAAKGAKGKKP
jgi:hypothetical protein